MSSLFTTACLPAYHSSDGTIYIDISKRSLNSVLVHIANRQGWELGIFADKLWKSGCFQKWFGHKYNIKTFGFLCTFERFAEF